MAAIGDSVTRLFLINPKPSDIGYAEKLLATCFHQDFIGKKLNEAGIKYMFSNVKMEDKK